ncbi:uncharacterized protein CBL_03789 [Carabus blaptoides fortunei]
MEESYIASLDVGTTTVRCYIFNSRAETVGIGRGQVELIYPKPGYVEINPEKLWETVEECIKDAIIDSKLSPGQITCLGISTQRCSFCCWNKKTGKSLHNFITWKDLRANKIVKQWNESLSMKGLRFGSNCLYLISRNKRYLAGSVLRIMNGQVTPRLAWCLQHLPDLVEAVREKYAMFGTVDTWILYKLSGGKLHVTDVSNASATGFYDPFTFCWAGWALTMFKIPTDILPVVIDTAGDIGSTDKSLFGAEIPIKCSMADQSASMFGSCCFEPGDMKVTLGTGSFLNVNTGRSAHASATGIYPLVAWRFGNEYAYAVEGASNDTGSLIQWAMGIGLFSDPADTCYMAQSVQSNDGIYFIPAFSGLGAPINDFKAASGFLGLKPTTNKAHMVRSILESIAFRVVQLYDVVHKETPFPYRKIRIDGGVSKNDFICQMLSDLTTLTVQRARTAELSVVGAAYLAGLTTGIWTSKDELKRLSRFDTEFQPNEKSHRTNRHVLENWCRVLERFRNWYPHEVSELELNKL